MSHKTVNEHIRDSLLLPYHFPRQSMSLSALQYTQWCDEYEYYRRNRMVMGFFRYGDIHRQDLDSYDLPEEAIKRIRRYQHDRNLEHLVDAGNMLMLAYMQGKRDGHTFKPIDDGEHAQQKG